MTTTVPIEEDFITLGQLLKTENIISSGGMAKWYLAETTVLVDGEEENRRGRKLYPGMTIEIEAEGTFVIQQANSPTNGAVE